MFCEESTKPQHGQRPDINRPRQRQPIPILEARKVSTAVRLFLIEHQPNIDRLPPPPLKFRAASSTHIRSNSPKVRSSLISPSIHALLLPSLKISTFSGGLAREKVDVAVKGEEDVASGDRVAVHNLRGREEHVQSPAQTGGRMHSVNGNLSDHSNNQQRKDKAANHITGRRGHDHGVERALQEEPEEEEITCDPYNGGDELCTASISDAQARALEIQGTSMYCSRECDSRGGRYKSVISRHTFAGWVWSLCTGQPTWNFVVVIRPAKQFRSWLAFM